MIDLAALLVVVLVVVVLPATIARWVFGPLDRAAKGRRHPVQFTLADLLCLFFLMQLSMGIGHSSPELRWTGAGWTITVYGWLAFGLLWLGHVRKLSLGGVRNGWHRSLCLVVVIPVGFAAAIAVPLLSGSIMCMLFHPEGLAMRLPLLMLCILADGGLLAVVYVLGRLTRRIVHEASISEAEAASALSQTSAGGRDSGDRTMVD